MRRENTLEMGIFLCPEGMGGKRSGVNRGGANGERIRRRGEK